MKIFKYPAFYIIIIGFALFWHNSDNRSIYSPRRVSRIKENCRWKMTQLSEEIALYQKKQGFIPGEFDITKLKKDYDYKFSCPFSYYYADYLYTAKCGAITVNGRQKFNIEVSCENHGELSKQNDEHREMGLHGIKFKGFQLLFKSLYDINAAGIMIFLGFIWLIIDLRGYFSTHLCPACGLTFYELKAFETHLKQCRIKSNETSTAEPDPVKKSAFSVSPDARSLAFHELKAFETHLKQCMIKSNETSTTEPEPVKKSAFSVNPDAFDNVENNKAEETAICPAKRIAAFLIDTFLIFFLSLITILLMFFTLINNNHGTPEGLFTVAMPVFIFYLIKDIYNCQSVGKMLIGLDITNLNGSPASYKSLMLRNASFAVAFTIFGACFFESPMAFDTTIVIFTGILIVIIELLSMLSNKPGRRAGDYLARTKINDLNSRTTGWAYLFVSIVIVIMFFGLLEFLMPNY